MASERIEKLKVKKPTPTGKLTPDKLRSIKRMPIKLPEKVPVIGQKAVESVIFRCGHVHPAKILLGDVCPNCRCQKRKNKKSNVPEHFRFPTGTCLSTNWDGEKWCGSLVYPKGPDPKEFGIINAFHPNVETLLRLFKELFLEQLNSGLEKSSENPVKEG